MLASKAGKNDPVWDSQHSPMLKCRITTGWDALCLRQGFQFSSPPTSADGIRAPNGAQGKGGEVQTTRDAGCLHLSPLASRASPCEHDENRKALALPQGCCKVGNKVCQAGVKGAAASLRGVGYVAISRIVPTCSSSPRRLRRQKRRCNSPGQINKKA